VSHYFHADDKGQGGTSYSFLTLVLEGVSGRHLTPAALYAEERTPSTHWTGGWAGLRAGLDTEAFAPAGGEMLVAWSSSV
jgi:hypothetical protein